MSVFERTQSDVKRARYLEMERLKHRPGVRAIRGPPKMGPPSPRNARDVGTGRPEIASVIGTWGALNSGAMGIL